MRDFSELTEGARPQPGLSTGYLAVMILGLVMANPEREKQRRSRKHWGS